MAMGVDKFRLVLMLCILATALCDVYMHNPRGSNDRNCGGLGDNRDNDNLLYNSQNNAKGGYSCPRSFPFPCYKLEGDARAACNAQNTFSPNKDMVTCDGDIVVSQITNNGSAFPVVEPTKNKRMYYYEGSELMIQWTNQHGFGQNDELHSNVVIQYACDDTLTDSCGEIPDDVKSSENIFQSFSRPGFSQCSLRDGFPVNNNNNNDRLNGRATNTIPFQNDAVADNAVQDDCRYPRHESLEYYRQCLYRKRNINLYIGDRNLNNNIGSTATRQNNNGERFGYECPEERDYYPYWHWSPWKDIANVVSDSDFCGETREHSQNVKSKNRCFGCITCSEVNGQPNNKVECEGPAQGGKWVTDPSHNLEAPRCIIAPRSRQNHLGNGQDGLMPHINWTIPELPDGVDSQKCVVRVRYNITPGDYGDEARWGDKAKNGANALIRDDDSSEIGSYKKLTTEENSPRVALNINSNQFGRTFQDRSYVFEIRKRPADLCLLKTQKIHNLNVRGKRGNIVQTYPAVEYDFVPNQLTCETTEGIHFQWTGSDYNPSRNGNDGEGGPEDPQNGGNTLRCDRTNLLEVESPGNNNPMGNVDEDGVATNKFFNEEEALKLALLDQNDCKEIEELLALFPNDKTVRERHYQNCAKLNTAIPYFDGGVHCCGPKTGIFQFMSTRNNNFSNRDQKLTINVVRDAKLVIALTVSAAVLVAVGAGIFAYRRYSRKRNELKTAASTPMEEFDNKTLVTSVMIDGSMARALHDHEAAEKGELTFKKGQMIKVVKKDESGWWQGDINGRQGLFPSNYVTELLDMKDTL